VSDEHDGPTDESTRRVEQATAGLEDLRHLLIRAGEGHLDATDLRPSVEAYWRAHRPVFVALATALGEELRAQTLQALYQWRAELSRSLPPRRDPPR
jgi:hypothetical protein